MKETIKNELLSHLETISKVIAIIQDVETVFIAAIEALKNSNKILFCCNGGSSIDAQYIAAELSGRCKRRRRGLYGIALTTDTLVHSQLYLMAEYTNANKLFTIDNLEKRIQISVEKFENIVFKVYNK